MSAWRLVYEGFDPAREGLREALCTLGNGYFATRGAAPEAAAGGPHYPGTYLAGGFDRARTRIAGRTVENEDLVNLVNWLCLTFSVEGGPWFDLASVEVLDYRQELDLQAGLLHRAVRFRDGAGRVSSLVQRRLVHLARIHLAALETTLTPENWSGRVRFRSALDGRVLNTGVARYRDLESRHLEPLEESAVGSDAVFVKVRTIQSRIEVAVASRTRARAGEEAVEPERDLIRDSGYIAQDLTVGAAEGRPVTVEKVVALHTSRDRAISECGLAAREAIAGAPSFDRLAESQARVWGHLWQRFDIALDLDQAGAGERATLILRLHLFHLLQTVSMQTMDLDAGVPARGLHGEAYRGHIFWDELFIFPLFNFRVPEVTRALLMYRYRRLDAARRSARAAGFRGALFPWQSGSDGREETQELHLNPRSGRWLPDHSRLQRHVNAAIAFNIWQYFQVGHDMEFLSFHGAEMLLEIARFWVGIALWRPERGRYEIHGVVGPDEYHEAYPDSPEPGLKNHAYTNAMASWTLARALEVLDLLPGERRRELRENLGLEDREIEEWRKVSRRLFIPFHGEGIISEFEGYERLEDFDWEGYRERYGDIQRLDRILEAEGDTTNRYKVSKQADVLMLFYLFSREELDDLFGQLGYPFEPGMIPRNIRYYLERTSHGSTLSRVAHSWVLARLDRARSWHLFTEALESDVADIQGGTTPEGIHLGAMAGTVDLVQRCWLGLEARQDVLRFNPSLPDELACLRLRLAYRGHALEVEATRRRLVIGSRACAARPAPIRVGFREEERALEAGGKLELRLA